MADGRYPGLRYQVCPGGTWETAEARPHIGLRPGVIVYRGFRMALGKPRRRLETPVGAVTLVIGFGQRLTITGHTGALAYFDGCLAGLQTGATFAEHDGRSYGIEVLLAPWTAFTLFGVPMRELSERVVDPAELLGRRFTDLAGALAGTPGWAHRFALLDRVLARWSAAGPPCSAPVLRAWAALSRTGGALPVNRLATEVALSTRQLENRFGEQIGLRPKAVARVMRIQHGLRLLAAGRPPAQVAAACGFYDQAHFNGEFKAMIGRTPLEFVAARSARRVGPRPGEPPTVDRVDGEVTSLVLAG